MENKLEDKPVANKEPSTEHEIRPSIDKYFIK